MNVPWPRLETEFFFGALASPNLEVLYWWSCQPVPQVRQGGCWVVMSWCRIWPAQLTRGTMGSHLVHLLPHRTTSMPLLVCKMTGRKCNVCVCARGENYSPFIRIGNSHAIAHLGRICWVFSGSGHVFHLLRHHHSQLHLPSKTQGAAGHSRATGLCLDFVCLLFWTGGLKSWKFIGSRSVGVLQPERTSTKSSLICFESTRISTRHGLTLQTALVHFPSYMPRRFCYLLSNDIMSFSAFGLVESKSPLQILLFTPGYIPFSSIRISTSTWFQHTSWATSATDLAQDHLLLRSALRASVGGNHGSCSAVRGWEIQTPIIFHH